VLCQAIYTNQVALSAQIPMSSSKLLELVVIQIQKLGKCCRILLKMNCFRVLLIVLIVKFQFRAFVSPECTALNFLIKNTRRRVMVYLAESKRKLILTLTALCEWPVIISVCDRCFDNDQDSSFERFKVPFFSRVTNVNRARIKVGGLKSSIF